MTVSGLTIAANGTGLNNGVWDRPAARLDTVSALLNY